MSASGVTVSAAIFLLLASMTAAGAQDAERSCARIGGPVRFMLVPKRGTHDMRVYRAPDTEKSHGRVVMDVDILSDGSVKKVTMELSSGSEYFDTHAIEYVKQHWRWEPPKNLETGELIEACTRVTWTFDK